MLQAKSYGHWSIDSFSRVERLEAICRGVKTIGRLNFFGTLFVLVKSVADIIKRDTCILNNVSLI